MSYLILLVLHVVGALYLFLGLGAMISQRVDGADAGSEGVRKLAGMTHGLALLVILIAGFGILGVQGYDLGLWVWLKLALWLFFGGVIVLVRRMPHLSRTFWWLLPLVAGIAVYLCEAKPG
jgi:hypothetical protein